MDGKGIQVSIDRGGTFCDVIAKIPGEEDYVFKLLSNDPLNYRDAPTEGIRRVLEKFYGRSIPKDQKLSLDAIDSIRMGTTVATNALLERKGAKVCLLTTKGFRDVLKIGNQTRPNIFDLSAKKLNQLYLKVIEIDERVTLVGFTEGGGSKLKLEEVDEKVVTGTTGELVRIIREPDYEQIEKLLSELYATGEIECIALSLVHAYIFPEHEKKIALICRKIGFTVSAGHELQPMIGMVNRTSSVVADAYLAPILGSYIQAFGSGFEGGLEAFGNKLLFMQSNGGLCPWYNFFGIKAILSGPAGGLVGFGYTCFDSDNGKATIGFDAGGTSTDVSRYSGKLEHIYETVVNQVSLQTPQLDISTVAAGGGSMLFWRNGMFVSGPESAGSDPGPACYRKGGPLTVTDANLILGRLIPEYFPKIFGENQDMPLDEEKTGEKFEALTKEINDTKLENTSSLAVEQVACGFLKVAIESMCRPIRTLTEAKGYNISDHNLACFGGSGGQFAVALARNLGIEYVAIHKYSSLLSAYGIYLADIVIEKQRPLSYDYCEENFGVIDKISNELTDDAYNDYAKQNLKGYPTTLQVYLNMHFAGSDTCLLIEKGGGEYSCGLKFRERHQREFGFKLERSVIVEDVQVILLVHTEERKVHNPFSEYSQLLSSNTIVTTNFDKKRPIYFEEEGWIDTPVFFLPHIKIGHVVEGPAIILDNTQTILVEPRSRAAILFEHVLLQVDKKEKQEISTKRIDPIQLSVFGHRFMSIAEQMGRTLQQTAISTNIKERLDFSCAIFDQRGDLIANAPHIPIHLGAMSFAVKAQMNMWEGQLAPGDVLVSNHPRAGGSHLPDITVITPIFRKDTTKPVFWAASRGHHADIGSISAGSMPSNSKTIYQEGTAIVTFKLCSKGNFEEEGVTRLLVEEPAKYPGSSGTRALSDNISDLKAQVSANHKGLSLLENLTEAYTLPVIQTYLSAIQSAADLAVRNLLKKVYSNSHGQKLRAVDFLDDGTLISLEILIDPELGEAVFDFSETGDEVYANLNTPKAILYSAVLYVLRCLINLDMPLNNGCLVPIKIITREGSIVDPSYEAAVVGGNVETSQRIVDVILKTFGAAADSQGTSNNLTFGITDEKNSIAFGYYESICGGAGAGPNWNGQSAVHCHITNTRMTDVEVFEKRYPVIVHQYKVRENSGGDGAYRGGDGILREIEFTYGGLDISFLMERRSLAPHGIFGGKDGVRGVNTWLKTEYSQEKKALITRKIYLGGKASIKVAKGDRIVIMTPSGGGYGHPGSEVAGEEEKEHRKTTLGSGSIGMRSAIVESN